ncbi:MAG TPA: MarR family transcriptional regulator [Verrucomicrobiae bacterium]|nr:MarR family transcriptional regulator [Verrucomicrobiae bacterium]
MNRAAESCARELLETIPVVMAFIRDQIRRRRTAGLSLPQFRTLSFLNRTRSASLSAVAEHLGLSLPAMSRLINGLVAGRLVVRETVASNRRQVSLTLTPRGAATLEKVRREVRLQLGNVLTTLSAAEQKAIRRALRILHGVFENGATAKFSGKG